MKHLYPEQPDRHYSVITVGESTIDAFMKLAEPKALHSDGEHGGVCFKLGDKIDVDKYDFSIGGNATNVAVGLTRLGVKSTLVSETGDDEFSIKIRNLLASEHIERLWVNQVHGVSNFAVIINYGGDRTIFVQDVEREHDFQFEDVTADWVYITSLGRSWQEPYKKSVEFAQKTKAKIAFNPGSRQLREGDETVKFVIKHADILFVNKEEGEHFVNGAKKKDSPNNQEYIEELMGKLAKLGPKMIVMTNGKHGSYVRDEAGKFYFEEMAPGKVVERTGAGDGYASGFLAAYLHKAPLQQAMHWGSVNAASVVGHIGAQAGLLTKEEMEELVKEE